MTSSHFFTTQSPLITHLDITKVLGHRVALHTYMPSRTLLSYQSTSSDTQGSKVSLYLIPSANFGMERSLYERYGNNEPYTEPEPESVVFWYAQETPAFFQLITGPSTNFYVGPDKTHYTIPKRLLYEFSAFAKPCLEGNFAEATANATWLPDVSPDVFQWIWKWLYQGPAPNRKVLLQPAQR